MKIRGFSENGNWYKGNIHSHTVNSDGHLTPEEAVKLYSENGYSFLAFSEHDMYTDYREQFNRKDFIILPAIEASSVLMAGDGSHRVLKVHHIHGILGTSGMQKKTRGSLFSHMERHIPGLSFGEWNGADEAQKLCDMLKARGCITVYNHPVWSRVIPEEFINTAGLTAIEIFNYNTVNESGTGYDTTYWDLMLRTGCHINATASDDNHNEGLFPDSCGGYVMVKADELEHDAIIKALTEGNYYSSSGPEIYDWGIKDGKVFIRCSPVRRINFIAGNMLNYGGTIMSGNADECIDKGEMELKGKENYVRAECIDRYGFTAWTNPIYLQ